MLKFLPTGAILVLILSAVLFVPAPTPKKTDQQTAALDGGSCCKVEDVLATTGQFDLAATEAFFNNEQVIYPKQQLAEAFNSEDLSNSVVLGTTNSAGEEKWIEVNLDTQQLTAWEGNNIIKQYLISSGKWGRTPKGTFYIWYKTRSQLMKGGSKELGTYYYLPNVPHNMFFQGGYAIHGAYWHTNWGHTMSHGCVNEPLAEAAWIFDWAGPVVPEGTNVVKASAENPGTRVWIH